MAIRRPRVFRGPADHYAGPGERIVEYSYPDGTSKTPGGLISFRWDANSQKLVVALYRHEDKVEIHTGAPDADGRPAVWVLRWWDEHNDEIGVYASRQQALDELAAVAAHDAGMQARAAVPVWPIDDEGYTLALIAEWKGDSPHRGYELAEHAIGTQRTTSRT